NGPKEVTALPPVVPIQPNPSSVAIRVRVISASANAAATVPQADPAAPIGSGPVPVVRLVEFTVAPRGSHTTPVVPSVIVSLPFRLRVRRRRSHRGVDGGDLPSLMVQVTVELGADRAGRGPQFLDSRYCGGTEARRETPEMLRD